MLGAAIAILAIFSAQITWLFEHFHVVVLFQYRFKLSLSSELGKKRNLYENKGS
jgi:hypothetical protein